MLLFEGKDLKEISSKTSVGLVELISVLGWVPKTAEEAEEVCSILSGESKLYETFLTIWVDLIVTAEQAKEVCCRIRSKGWEIWQISMKWKELSQREYNEIKTFDDARKAFLGSKKDSNIQTLIIGKWVDLAETNEECKEIYTSIDSESKYRNIILSKWKNYCLNEAKTAKDIQKYYSFLLREGCDIKNEIIEKWIELARTVEDLLEILKKLEKNSELRKIVILKMVELS